MKLDAHRPERLVDELDIDDLVEAVLSLDGWSERRLTSVDYILLHWTAQIGARQDARSVAELEAALAQVLDRRPPPEPYGDRWRALGDVLEARRLTLIARDPERVAGMRHVQRILDHLRRADVTRPPRQGDLLRDLDLDISTSRLSQIVSLMETHGLVEVEQRGRERYLRMPAAARSSAPGGPDREHGEVSRTIRELVYGKG